MTPDPLYARSQVLAHFDHIEVYLLLGGAILTCALLSTLSMILQRRVDRLLLWFSLFAGAYGLHLILDYQLLWWLDLRPEALRRAVIALEQLTPVPGFFFLGELNLLGRFGRRLAAIIAPIAVCLAIATITIGPNYRVTNHVVLTVALTVFVIALLKSRFGPAEMRVLQVGVSVFTVCALWDHLAAIVGRWYHHVEPFGFLILIVCLGIVAGRRALAREQQLGLIQQELEIAQRIQRAILPETLPNPEFFRVAARYFPMTSVAGDFYDFIIPDGSHAGILIADVSGHGVPAALIASMVKLAAASQAERREQPAEFLHGMNRSLCGNTQKQFVTAAYVYLDASQDVLHYAAAAHPAMFILRGGEVLQVEENGLMLGAFSFAAYTQISNPLLAGDRILLYTDGILEARDTHGEEFGHGRLADLLKESNGMPTDETADRIIERIRHWAHVQDDDLTVIVCDYKCRAEASPACV